MTVTDEAPYLDLKDPTFAMDSDRVQEAREASWYARTNYGLAVLRYDEANQLLKDPRLRQGSRNWLRLNGISSGILYDWWEGMLLHADGDKHRRLRRLFNPAFSPRAVAPMIPRFKALGNELIDEFVDRGECEFMQEFARPYAARVIAIILGIPESEWPNIASWATDLALSFTVAVNENLPTINSALENMYGHADELVALRRDEPGEDFVSELVRVNTEDDRLSSEELRNAIVAFMIGGMDTTASQLGLAIQTFIEHQDQWRLLAARPELGRAAVEEVMRTHPTVTWVTREAQEDFVFQDLPVEAGTTLHFFSETAGTDPRAFPDQVFDITAERQPHFGFGGGMHHCIGHFVARADMSEALPLLARRLSDPRLAGVATSLPHSGNTGPIELPIKFTPGAER